MTENLAARGEGLARLAKAILAYDDEFMTVLVNGRSVEQEKADYAWAAIIKQATLLEAAAPAGTAHANLMELIANIPLPEGYKRDENYLCRQGWAEFRDQLRVALATPSPQAPQCTCYMEANEATNAPCPIHNAPAATQEQPAGSGALETWLAAQRVTLSERQLDAVKGYIVMNLLPVGSPRKVGEDALTQERARMIAACLIRDCTAGWKRTRESVIEEIASTLLKVAARSSSVPVGEQKQEEGV